MGTRSVHFNEDVYSVNLAFPLTQNDAPSSTNSLYTTNLYKLCCKTSKLIYVNRV